MSTVTSPEIVVGKKVRKKSDRPFKSTYKVNTVKGIVTHPILGIDAYVFEEDDTCVEARRCEIINE